MKWQKEIPNFPCRFLARDIQDELSIIEIQSFNNEGQEYLIWIYKDEQIVDSNKFAQNFTDYLIIEDVECESGKNAIFTQLLNTLNKDILRCN